MNDRIEYLTEAKLMYLLKKAVNNIKGRLREDVPNNPKYKSGTTKARKKGMELEYDILISNKNIVRFLRDYDPDYLKQSQKEILREMEICLDGVSNWIDTLNKQHNANLNKEEMIDRFLPFYDLGNGDYGMLDRKTKDFVWFAHDDIKVIVDQKGNRVQF